MFLRRAVVVGMCLAGVSLQAQTDPGWWSSGVTRTGTANNYGPLTLGQLMNLADQARIHLDTEAGAAGGAGPEIEEMVAGWPDNPPSAYRPANLGQLKAIADKFYTRLDALGFDYKTQMVNDQQSAASSWHGAPSRPWNDTTAIATNYAIANIGQAKLLFSWDLTKGLLHAISTTLTMDEDTTGVITLGCLGAGTGPATYQILTNPSNGTAVLNGATVSYYPKTQYNGPDSFTFQVTKGGQTNNGTISIVVNPVDDAPLVSVGGGRSIVLPNALALSATITDYDTAASGITQTWVKVSGPGEVTFADASQKATTASFSAAGDYVLRLIATDAHSVNSDSLQVRVNAASVALPTVTMQSLGGLYAPGAAITLQAIATASGGATISKVEFYEGSRKVGETTTPVSSPTSGLYQVSWAPTHWGAYQISAVATTSAGGKGFSSNSVVARVGVGMWFSSTGAGNEGYSGTGGDGGAIAGNTTGPAGTYASGTGSDGGGTVAGAGGDGTGGDSEKDTDDDGLSDYVELTETDTQINNPDSDGDSLQDGEDAVPDEMLMTVPAASEVNYAIVDLGSDPHETAEGVSDRGQVLLTKPNTSGTPGQGGFKGMLWNGAPPVEIADSGNFFGPLSDGSVYYAGPAVDVTRASGSTGPYYRAETEAPFKKRDATGATSDAGDFLQSRDTDSQTSSGLTPTLYSAYDPFTKVLDATATGAVTSGVSDISSKLYGKSAWANDCFANASISGMNDTGFKTFTVGISGGLVSFGRVGYRDLKLNGWIGGGACTVADGAWWTFLDSNQGLTVYSDRKQIGQVKVNSTAMAVATRSDPAAGTSEGVYFNSSSTPVAIPNSTMVVDINEARTPEGPYFVGQNNELGKIWAYHGGALVSHDTGVISSGGNSKVSTRGISNSLVIPAGDSIWRNNRIRKIADLCGKPKDWSAFDIRFVSPNTNLLLGQASESGVVHQVLLLPFEVIPSDAAAANTDQTTLYFTAGIPDTDEDHRVAEGGKIEWKVESGSGTLDELETTIEGDHATVGLDISNVSVGEKIKVKARIKNLSANGSILNSSWVSSGEVEVFPGYPESVAVTTTKGKLHNDGAETTEVEATFRDGDGNLVMDGTPVSWSVPGSDAEFTQVEDTTTNGKAKATLRAGILADDVTLRVAAGNAVYAQSYSIELLSGSLQSNRSSIDVATAQTATMTLSVNAQDGTPVYWFTSTGSITESSTVSGGAATATLSSTDAQLGTVVVWAAVGGKSFLWNGTITASQGLYMGAVHKVLATGEVSDGIVTVQPPSNVGPPVTVPYYVSTDIVIKGPPNAVVTVTAPYFDPPMGLMSRSVHPMALSGTQSSNQQTTNVAVDGNGNAVYHYAPGNIPDGTGDLTLSFSGTQGQFSAVLKIKTAPKEKIGLAETILNGLLGDGGSSGLGIASELIGGIFLGNLQDTATILKNVGRLAGVVDGKFEGGAVMWAMAGFIPGTHIAKAIGKVAEIIGSGKALTKVLSAATSEAYKVDGNLDEWITSGKYAFAERLENDATLISKLDSSHFSQATLDHCGRIERELGDQFFTKLKQIDGTPDDLVGMIDVIGGSSDEALQLLKQGGLNGGTLESAMDGIHAAVKSGHNPETLTKVLNKTTLDTPNHNRVDLFRDLGKKGEDGKALAEVDGMDKLVNKLTRDGDGGPGNKYELQNAAFLQDEGFKILSVNEGPIPMDLENYIPRPGSKGVGSNLSTDLDVKASKGGKIYNVQSKISNQVLNWAPGLRSSSNWIGAIKKAFPNEEILFMKPPNVTARSRLMQMLKNNNLDEASVRDGALP